MSFGHFIDPATGTYTDDHLIGKAMEALRVQFPTLPQSFYGANWERARLILRVEGRTSHAVYTSLLPFAESQANTRRYVPSSLRETRELCDQLLKEKGIR